MKKKKNSFVYLPPTKHIQPAGIHNEFYDTSIRDLILDKSIIFVYDSNYSNSCFSGSAKVAKEKYGAKSRKHRGYNGNAYGIPTRDEYKNPLPFDVVQHYIHEFVKETQKGNHTFFVTPITGGVYHFNLIEIAKSFKGCQYCWLPELWLPEIIS